mmetsp:Transcript_12379/g.29096  ORF Transcript_12379/g.29096 Transcript_12379/m.29096 type:complete len:248 (-) Transcript_12379:2401-3144(-)
MCDRCIAATSFSACTLSTSGVCFITRASTVFVLARCSSVRPGSLYAFSVTPAEPEIKTSSAKFVWMIFSKAYMRPLTSTRPPFRLPRKLSSRLFMKAISASACTTSSRNCANLKSSATYSRSTCFWQFSINQSTYSPSTSIMFKSNRAASLDRARISTASAWLLNTACSRWRLKSLGPITVCRAKRFSDLLIPHRFIKSFMMALTLEMLPSTLRRQQQIVRNLQSPTATLTPSSTPVVDPLVARIRE